MTVTVRYVFGLARGVDGRDEMRLELPGGATVFEAMRHLGVASLELHAAVNGESAGDGTVLEDGDRMTLIPAIQGGGSGEGRHPMSRIAMSVIGLTLGLGTAHESAAQMRLQAPVVVPIIIQAPTARAGAAPAAPSTPTETRVYVNGGRSGTSPTAPTQGTGFATSPTTSREIRVFIQGTGSSSTPMPFPRAASAPLPPPSSTPAPSAPAPRSFATAPSSVQEVRIFVHDGRAAPETAAPSAVPRGFATSPTRSQEVRVFVDGDTPVEIPLVVVAE